jgi:hypothetical protein
VLKLHTPVLIGKPAYRNLLTVPDGMAVIALRVARHMS